MNLFDVFCDIYAIRIRYFLLSFFLIVPVYRLDEIFFCQISFLEGFDWR